MKPKQKAQELYNKFFLKHEYVQDEKYGFVLTALNKGLAKKCALITVDEMLDFQNNLFINEGSLAYKYWLKVKQEIEKL